jgi:hypothetical protein
MPRPLLSAVLLLALLVICAIAGLLLTGCISLRPFTEVRREIPAARFVEVAG